MAYILDICVYYTKSHANFIEELERYVTYFNAERPAYALNHKSPVQFKTEQGFG